MTNKQLLEGLEIFIINNRQHLYGKDVIDVELLLKAIDYIKREKL